MTFGVDAGSMPVTRGLIRGLGIWAFLRVSSRSMTVEHKPQRLVNTAKNHHNLLALGDPKATDYILIFERYNLNRIPLYIFSSCGCQLLQKENQVPACCNHRSSNEQSSGLFPREV